MKWFNYLCLVTFFCACQSKAFKTEKEYKIVSSESFVDFGEHMVTPKTFSPTIANYKGKNAHIFIDQNLQIVISDLDSKELIEIIPLQRDDGPKMLHSHPNKAIPLQKKHFLITSLSFFYIVDQKGDVIKKINLEKIVEDQFSRNQEDHFFITARSSYCKIKENELIFSLSRNLPMSGPVPAKAYPYFPLFIQLKINPTNWQIEWKLLDVSFPEEFVKSTSLSYWHDETPKYLIEGKRLIYFFRFSSKLFFHDLETGKNSSLELNIEDAPYTSSPASSPEEGNKILKYAFLDTYIDTINKIIYRIHQSRNFQDLMGSERILNSYSLEGKPLVSHSLGTIKEHLYSGMFGYKDQYYLTPFEPSTSEEHLEFFQFKLVEKNQHLSFEAN
ncbi:hypothetical protein [Echinicola sp. 20G]|uniref:hypothetical protein n=1 Tax=Echinicola sp. 20G TaxID=2781961 RepID=UPI0019101379|nr:hypothetical protein [Echinicola sp. 20G]